MKKCPNGHEVNDNLRFCPQCGAELKDNGTKFCKKCGAERKGTEKFCSKCGNPFEGTPTPQPIPQPTLSSDATETSTDYRKIVIPIVIGLVILALVGGGWWYSNSSKTPQVDEVLIDSLVVEDTIDTLLVDDTIDTLLEDDTENTSEQDIKLITEWYNCVLGNKEISEAEFDKFLSNKIKVRIWTEDYEGCYEYWQFRTTAQDCNPESDVSKVEDISENGDGWYEVKYLDMGWQGKTTIKIENGKIVDFVPDSSWSDN